MRIRAENQVQPTRQCSTSTWLTASAYNSKFSFVELRHCPFRWHRVGISVRKRKMAFNIDGQNFTTKLTRTYPNPKLDTDGIMYLSRQILNDDIWEVGDAVLSFIFI